MNEDLLISSVLMIGIFVGLAGIWIGRWLQDKRRPRPSTGTEYTR